MSDMFAAGGFFMWPILVSLIAILYLTARSIGRLRGSGAEEAAVHETVDVRHGIDAIVFWGGFGALVGLFGTIGGLGQMGRAIEAAGDVSAGLVWGGVYVSLITSGFGLAVLLLSMLIWFALRAVAQRRTAPHG